MKSVTFQQFKKSFQAVKNDITKKVSELAVAITEAIEELENQKANKTHTHAASDITSGTLPVTRGGTGNTTGNAATATKLKTARTIDGMNFDGNANIVHFGICNTAADVTTKEVSLPGFVLAQGARVAVYFAYANTAGSPMLNINGTGAHYLAYRNGNYALAGQWETGDIVEFVYYNNHWIMLTANARKLTTARTIALSGDVTGSASFDGSANKTITATLKNSGVTAGTYGANLNSLAIGTWISNNRGLHSTTATSTWTAKQDITMSFRYTISSESVSFDYLNITAAGTQILTNTGGTATTNTLTATLKTGQTIVFNYRKDGSNNTNEDCAKISEVKVTPTGATSATVVTTKNFTTYFTATNGTYGFLPLLELQKKSVAGGAGTNGFTLPCVVVDSKGRVTTASEVFVMPAESNVPLPIAEGGTGATSASKALSNLGGLNKNGGNTQCDIEIGTNNHMYHNRYNIISGVYNYLGYNINLTKVTNISNNTFTVSGMSYLSSFKNGDKLFYFNIYGSSSSRISEYTITSINEKQITVSKTIESKLENGILGYIYVERIVGTNSAVYSNLTLGANNINVASNSHIIGQGCTNTGSNNYILGNQIISTTSNSMIIGKYNNHAKTGFFVIGNGTDSSARSNCFRVTNTDGVYSNSTYKSSGADYAEIFEWLDGNMEHEDRKGLFVTLRGDKIVIATPNDDYILGIVSACPSVCGDVNDDVWKGMFETTIFGTPILEEVEVPERTEQITTVDENGEEITETVVIEQAHTEIRQKLNPEYDNTQEYIPRSERPEWDAVGVLGKLVAIDDGTCEVDGWCKVGQGGVATKSEQVTKYRVMKRLDKNHIKVFIA